ncbi:MAG TPA: LamB/YcsF family protein [Saprospiraceae bacterium]|nr:LamB/YcsF family protein [Saprospiraceae bacterium]
MKVAINMDFGEQIAHLDESSMVGKVDQCSIACGYHAGDGTTIFNALKFCQENDVSIGAHPSYPDRSNFGREIMHLPPKELLCHLIYQLAAFKSIAKFIRMPVLHVKLHGALYNEAMLNEAVAKTTIEAMEMVFPNAAIMAMADSALAFYGMQKGFDVWKEGFADRLYESATKLVPRSVAGSLLTSPDEVKRQIENLKSGFVIDNQDHVINLAVDTICIHGDNPNINNLLAAL